MFNKIVTFSLATAATALQLQSDDSDMCCVTCSSPNEKFYSIDTTHNMCGEACMDPKDYWLYKIFEWGLEATDSNTPCHDHGYDVYDSTPTHGFGPITMTLDLYGPNPSIAVEEDDTPCCNSCTEPQEKYYSIDTAHGYCGECCMKPEHYWLFKIFEPGLEKADSNSVCADKGYTIYTDTPTHGVPPLTMTLDLYAPTK